MSPLSIEYFVEVSRLGSISRAALELGIEQSTITRHISRLESDIGVRLFHRSGRGVELTDAGRIFLTRARHVVQALADARSLATELAGQGPRQIVVAAQPTMARQTFGALATALAKRYPGARLRFMEGLGHQLMNWLATGEVDFALLYVPTQAHVVEFDELLKEPLYCVAAPSVRLPDGPMDVRTLLGLAMVLPSTQHGLRGLMVALSQQEDIPLQLAIECDASVSVTKRLVQEGHGCTILPAATVARETEAGLLQARPVDDPRMQRTIAIATARNRPMMEAGWEIRQIIRQVSVDLVERGSWPGARLIVP